jgi:integrase
MLASRLAPFESFPCIAEGGPWYLWGPRLLDRVRTAIRARHLSLLIEKAYVFWARFILFHRKRHPAEMAAPEVTAFLSSLAIDGRVAASTQNQALCALLFLYRHVLGPELPWLDDLVLRVKDGNEIVVRAGKGDRDRRTMLPAAPSDPLARVVSLARHRHQRDLAAGAGWVALPHALGRKYPNVGREWGWQWVFSATRIHVDAQTGQRRRHHLHESVLQRAVRKAVLRAGIAKPATCHTFRHSFASTSWNTATTSARSRSSSAIAT